MDAKRIRDDKIWKEGIQLKLIKTKLNKNVRNIIIEYITYTLPYLNELINNTQHIYTYYNWYYINYYIRTDNKYEKVISKSRITKSFLLNLMYISSSW